MVSVKKLSAVAVAACLVGTAFAADLTINEPTTITESANYERGDIGADLTIDPSVKVSFSGNVQLASGVTVSIGQDGKFFGTETSAKRDNLITNLGAGFSTQGGTSFGALGNDSAVSLWLEKMVLPSTATTEADTFDVLTLNGCSFADITCFANENTTKPARYIFNGGLLRQYYKNSAGRPMTISANATTVFEGVNGKNIIVVPTYSTSVDFFAGEGTFETRGNCDFIVANQGEVDPLPAAPCTKKDENVFNLATNKASVNRSWFRITSNGKWKWGHAGNLCLQSGAWVRLSRENGLPYGPNTGIVRLYDWDHKPVIVGSSVPPRLDLNGYNACINGLVSADGCEVTNFATAVTSTLTFGAEDMDGTLQAKICGNINVEKVGAGTLSISKSVLPQAFAAKAGTTVISSDMHIPEIILTAGAALTIDGATVTYDTLHDSGATVTLLNGGRLVWLKSGAGERMIQAVDAPFSGDRAIRVQDGTLTFVGDLCTNEWWRFRFRGSTAGKGSALTVARLQLTKKAQGVFSDTASKDGQRNYNANFIACSLLPQDQAEEQEDGKYMYPVETATPAKDLERGKALATPGIKFVYDLDAVFSSTQGYSKRDIAEAMQFSGLALNESDPSTWVDITFRLNEGMNIARGYTMNSYKTWYCRKVGDGIADGVRLEPLVSPC